MRLIIAGGGTGGHLFPALAIAEAVKRLDPSAEILFVGTKHGLEAKILPSTAFQSVYISARGMRKTGLINKIRGGLELPLGIFQSIKILFRFKPDFVLGVGGYASGPTLLAAAAMNFPSGIQEQNSVMGTTNRFLSKVVDKIFTSWEKTEPETNPNKTISAGNPIRRELLTYKSQVQDPSIFRLLIFGGSRGAASINKALVDGLARLADYKDILRVTHQTGERAADDVREAYRAVGIHADVFEFITEMGPFYQHCDLVICRSGASTLAELAALGKPAILIPYPYAIGDHQAKNAEEFVRQGAARIVYDRDINRLLIPEILELLGNRELLRQMSEKAAGMGRPDAADIIAREILSVRSPA